MIPLAGSFQGGTCRTIWWWPFTKRGASVSRSERPLLLQPSQGRQSPTQLPSGFPKKGVPTPSRPLQCTRPAPSWRGAAARGASSQAERVCLSSSACTPSMAALCIDVGKFQGTFFLPFPTMCESERAKVRVGGIEMTSPVAVMRLHSPSRVWRICPVTQSNSDQHSCQGDRMFLLSAHCHWKEGTNCTKKALRGTGSPFWVKPCHSARVPVLISNTALGCRCR